MAIVRAKPAARLLRLATVAAVCRIALTHLEAAVQAHARLLDDADAEALHDLRVALRRLRSLLRAYRPWLGRTVPGKLRRQLRELARATNEARDAEVQLAWLAQHRLRLSVRERAGVEWFRAALAARCERAYRHIREELTHDFARVESALRAACTRAGRRGRATEPRFRAVAARLVDEHAAALRAALASIGSPRDEAQIHGARIAAKRLRYLLEPLAPELAGGRELVKRLKRFQDDFGGLNDSFVRARALADAAQLAAGLRARRAVEHALGAADSAAEGIDPLAGLRRLAAAVKRETRARYAHVERRYLNAGADRFITTVLHATRELARAPGRKQ